MARIAISLTVFLFLLTLSHARDLQNPFSEPEPEKIHEPETKPRQHDTVSLTLDSVDPVPLTLLHFHPINRHILPRRWLPLPHHRCRHGHLRELAYGNDMIFQKEDAGKSPIQWGRIHDSDPEMMHHFRHHGRSHHHHHEKGWFAKRISEFLNLF